MKTVTLLFAGLLVAATAFAEPLPTGSKHADDSHMGAKAPSGHLQQQTFESLDSDSNGTLSPTETGSMVMPFSKADSDSNGRLDRNEYKRYQDNARHKGTDATDATPGHGSQTGDPGTGTTTTPTPDQVDSGKT